MKLPKPPTVTETAPGDIQFEPSELAQYNHVMIKAKAEFDRVMQGAEDDADEITRRLMDMFK
jgi:hypothetical protein